MSLTFSPCHNVYTHVDTGEHVVDNFFIVCYYLYNHQSMDITTCLHSPKCVRFLSSLSVRVDFCPIVTHIKSFTNTNYHSVLHSLSICHDTYGLVVAQAYEWTTSGKASCYLYQIVSPPLPPCLTLVSPLAKTCTVSSSTLCIGYPPVAFHSLAFQALEHRVNRLSTGAFEHTPRRLILLRL